MSRGLLAAELTLQDQGCPKRMASFANEAEVEFAPRPGLTLTLDEDEQQVTLAVVKPEDRIRIVAVSLQRSQNP